MLVKFRNDLPRESFSALVGAKQTDWTPGISLPQSARAQLRAGHSGYATTAAPSNADLRQARFELLAGKLPVTVPI